MKKFENFSREDLSALRNEIVLNSLYFSDFENSFGINCKSVAAFFDGYVDYLWELAIEKYGEEKVNKMNGSNIFDEFDNADNLESWYYCYGDFDWVEYDYNDEED